MSITGTLNFAERDGRRYCTRCGHRLSGRSLARRPDGLYLCNDCRSDRWLIERMARR